MDGKVVIGTEIDTSGFDKEITLLESKLNDVSSTLQMASEDKTLFTTREIQEMEAEAQKLGRKLTSLREKQAVISNPPTSNGLIEFLQKAGKETEKNIKKVGKWALAIFGIRSIYSTIRQAISQISAEDTQIANDIAYMKWILAQTLKPVIEWIIQALYFVVALVNNIFGSLFSINLLAGKGADEFKNMKKNTGGISKDLKEAKKQLASFDEMNVLQDSTSGAGGGSGIDEWNPPDLGKYEKQIKQLQKEWKKFGNEMKDALENMTVDDWLNSFGRFGIVVRGITEVMHGLWDVVDGFFNAVSGLADIIVGIVTGDTEKIKNGVIKMLNGLLQSIKGFYEMSWGLTQIGIGLIAGLVSWLWEHIRDAIALVVDWFRNSSDSVKSIFGDTIGAIYDSFVDGIETIMQGLNRIYEGAKNIFKGIVELVRNLIKGDWRQAWEEAKNIFGGIIQVMFGMFEAMVGRFKAIASSIGGAIAGALKLAITFVINSLLGHAENVLNTPIRGINALLDIVNKISPAKISRLTPLRLPRLAKGGIVNMPSKGVPIGGAIAGEKGQEGVIPLTDSQQMELLGEAIGKYITINANITNTMNGRVISRELQKIQNENDFAYNR